MNVRGGIQNRIHKLLDRRGIQIGGILTVVFGLNGSRILTGLRDGKSTEEIMSTLTDHVASKFKLIRDVLTKSLDEEDRYLLGELIEMRDEGTRHIESAFKRLKEQATPWQRNLDMLQTIPGIGDQSAAGLLSEMGADLDVFGSPSRFAAWAVFRRQRECGQNASRQGSDRQRSHANPFGQLRPRRRSHQGQSIPWLPPNPHSSTRLQTSHRRHRPQAGENDLCRPSRPKALRRSGRRLRRNDD